ncbi:unnamed protein product [Schistosoma spindalis]|nr:unnamed protein product [Schistosoma spindale]
MNVGNYKKKERNNNGGGNGKVQSEEIFQLRKIQPLFMKKVKEGYSRIATGFYSEPYLITSLATALHRLSDPNQGVVKDQQKLALCSFLSYHDTMSYTDHLSAFSNQFQSRQIMHDVEFSGTTFVEHVQATEVGVSRW